MHIYLRTDSIFGVFKIASFYFDLDIVEFFFLGLAVAIWMELIMFVPEDLLLLSIRSKHQKDKMFVPKQHRIDGKCPYQGIERCITHASVQRENP
jgi:hypothetical protein